MLEEIKGCFEKGRIKYSFYIKNLRTGDIIANNEHVIVLSASTIKLLIMAEAYNQVNLSKISLSSRIKIKEGDRIPSSILSLLSPDNTYTIKDLITLMIIQSDNTATNVLIDILGLKNINKYIRNIGLENTELNRKMLDISARSLGIENLTSALDLGKFLELLYEGKVVNHESSMEMLEIMKKQLDRTMIRTNIPDDIEIAHKTGELEKLQHDAGIVFGGSSDYIGVFMTWDAENNNFARNCIAEAAGKVHKLLCNNQDKET